MTEETNRRGRYIAFSCALFLAMAAVASTSLFSFNDSWIQNRILATVALYLLAIPLFEFGNSGKWFPLLTAPKGVLLALLRGFVGIFGVMLLLSALGFCLATGPGKCPRTTVGFIFGMCGTSIVLIRSAITGTWFPGSGNKNTAPPVFQNHLPLR